MSAKLVDIWDKNCRILRYSFANPRKDDPMSQALHRIFVAHPQSVDETYFQHMRFAGWFALKLFGAALAAFVHAIIPCLFEKTASRMICDMHARLVSRH